MTITKENLREYILTHGNQKQVIETVKQMQAEKAPFTIEELDKRMNPAQQTIAAVTSATIPTSVTKLMSPDRTEPAKPTIIPKKTQKFKELYDENEQFQQALDNAYKKFQKEQTEEPVNKLLRQDDIEDEFEDEEYSGSTVLTIAAVVIAVILVFLLFVILILQLAPNTGIALFLDNFIEGITGSTGDTNTLMLL